MTLNDLECRNSPYFSFFSPNSTDFLIIYDIFLAIGLWVLNL